MRIRRGGFLPRFFLILSLFLLATVPLTGTARASGLATQDPAQQSQDPSQAPDQDQSVYANFTPDQLDNLLAPIALYPDPLLAQVLVAATFPDQIDEASRFLRGGGNPDDIDNQDWDVSVKAVAHYPTVLYMMDNKLDWTTSVGQAYVNQSADVDASIQRLRGLAHDAGTLDSGPQMQVVNQDGYWNIWPVEPQLLYVPIYDPGIVFIGRHGFYGPYITYGVGFPIGAWLCYDFNWGGPGVYYFGWGGPLARPWAVRSRPFVRLTSVYVNDRYRTIAVNRAVIGRRVNVENLNRYNAVHREVHYTNVAVGNVQRANERVGEPSRAPVNNQVIQRNVNPSDGRIDQFRGREGEAPAAARPAPAPVARPAERPPAPSNSAFDTDRRTFPPAQTSQRGQASRQAPVSRPAPAPAPRAAPAPRPSGGGGRRP
jgi:Protein of unknown function (DUF3300)